MTEQQLWFLLIFSIPFAPAFIVFKLIKPKSGDAKIGGVIPIVKDLQIELGGAIATYVVIVLVALFAHSLITEDKRLVITIEPRNSDGQKVNKHDVNVERMLKSPFVLTAFSRTGERFPISSSEFDYDEETFNFTASPEVYLRAEDPFGHVYFNVEGSRFAPPPTTPLALEITNNGNYNLELELKSELLADWMSVASLSWVDIGAAEVRVTDVTILYDFSKEGIARVSFGTMNASGLMNISTEVWEGKPDLIKNFLTEVEDVVNKLDGDSGEALRQLSQTLINKHSRFQPSIGSDDWTAPNQETGLVKRDTGARPSVFFIHAPSKRISLPSGQPGRYILVHESSELKQQLRPGKPGFGVIYDHATKLGMISVLFDESALVGPNVRPTIRGPGGEKNYIPDSNIAHAARSLLLFERDLPKQTEIDIQF